MSQSKDLTVDGQLRRDLVLLDVTYLKKPMTATPDLWDWDRLLDLRSAKGEKAEARPPEVWVARWEHRSGGSIRVFLTEDAALEWKVQLALAWWDDEIPDSELRPTDDHELADRYFEIMGERSSNAEYFGCTEVEIGA